MRLGFMAHVVGERSTTSFARRNHNVETVAIENTYGGGIDFRRQRVGNATRQQRNPAAPRPWCRR